jgi:hypothetical protein
MLLSGRQQSVVRSNVPAQRRSEATLKVWLARSTHVMPVPPLGETSMASHLGIGQLQWRAAPKAFGEMVHANRMFPI